jgi:plasmid stability protein
MTDLSIKGVPTEQVASLRERAARNHRSLQGELRAILDAALQPKAKTLTLDELAAHGRHAGLKTPSESARMIREDRGR